MTGPHFDRRSGENHRWISVLVVLLSNVAAIAWFAATLSSSVAQLQREAALDRSERLRAYESMTLQIAKNSVDIEILKDRESRKAGR